MKRTATILTLAILVVSAAIPLSATAGSAQQETYAGSHVTFETAESAVVDYRVDGEQTVDSVRVQSQSETNSDIGLGSSADIVTSADIAGSNVAVDTQTAASARMTTESGAIIAGHDNGHGSLVVTADEQSQYVAVDLNESADATQVNDERVVFTTDDGTQAAAMVAGDGNVSVTEEGNLTAALDQDSRLVVRTYTDARSEADATQESMIVNGTAAASVYVMEQGGQQVTDTVNYTGDTSVEVQQRSEQRVEMTASRTASEGRVVITHFANTAVESAEDVDVRVDGSAAVQASSYSEVRQATDGGDSSKYVVESASEASAQSQVVLGINHFSTRSVTMDASDDSTETQTDTGSDDSTVTATDDTDSSSGDGTTTDAGSTDTESYVGSHVAFETTSDAVVDYRVDGEQTVDSVRVQSQSNADSNLGVGASADVLTSTDILGATLSLDATTETSAHVTTESGATIEGHDNGHGSLVVTADEQSQYVAVNLSDSTEAEKVSEQRVVFTTDDGTQATAMVAGDGNVSVTEQGNLTASLDQDSRLVVRTYSEERTSADETEEEMIVDGTAAASVYVMQDGGERTTDTVNYTEDTTVAVHEESKQRVNMTVSRSEEAGRVVITHLSDAVAESSEELDVRVDGETAVQASSYSEVRQATNGGDTSKYMVQSSGEASAQSRVILGINHFSSRSVTMGSGDSTDAGGSDEGDTSNSEETTTGTGPGFSVVVSLIALLAAAGIARRR